MNTKQKKERRCYQTVVPNNYLCTLVFMQVVYIR